MSKAILVFLFITTIIISCDNLYPQEDDSKNNNQVSLKPVNVNQSVLINYSDNEFDLVLSDYNNIYKILYLKLYPSDNRKQNDDFFPKDRKYNEPVRYGSVSLYQPSWDGVTKSPFFYYMFNYVKLP
jgi:hypothetical protein